MGIGHISDLINHGDWSRSTLSLSISILTCQPSTVPSPVGPPLGTTPSLGLYIAVYRTISPSFICSLISFPVLDPLIFSLAVPLLPSYQTLRHQLLLLPFWHCACHCALGYNSFAALKLDTRHFAYNTLTLHDCMACGLSFYPFFHFSTYILMILL